MNEATNTLPGKRVRQWLDVIALAALLFGLISQSEYAAILPHLSIVSDALATISPDMIAATAVAIRATWYAVVEAVS